MINSIAQILKKHPLLTTWISAIWNIAYGVFHLYIGVDNSSYWYITLAAFFLTLGFARLMVLAENRNENSRMRRLAYMLFFLAVVISGTTTLTITETIHPIKNEILVIAQAAYTFSVLIAAVYNTVTSYRKKDKTAIMIRNISLASALGSLFSLERTMLGTFGTSKDTLFNTCIEAFTGLLIFTVLNILAYNLLKKSKE